MVRKSNRPRRHRAGFSLLELMLVIAIMGVLMAVVGFNVLGSGERAKKRATEATLKNVQTQLNSYHLETSAWPPDLQTLVTTKFLDDVKLVDGWGTPLMYDPRPIAENQPYALGSSGKDKAAGNEDDINIWTMNK
jgi:general secretion pathway protein G